MRDNRHMNLFEHYTQTGATIPHENNVSRALAILLDTEPLLFDRFIDLVNEKLASEHRGEPPVNKPSGKSLKGVGFQQSASSLAEAAPGRIVCLTLTPDGQNTDGRATNTDNPKDPITDIAISCDDDLIIVEVKTQDGTTAKEQVTSQAERVRSFVNGGGKLSVSAPLGITWGEVIKILGDVNGLQGPNGRSVLAHYMTYLTSRWRKWLNVAPFSAFMDQEAALTRIQNLADKCAQIIDTGSRHDGPGAGCLSVEWIGDSAVVPLPEKLGFTREFHLSAEWDGQNLKGVKAVFWPGNNKKQAYFLFNDPSVSDNMSWTQGGSVNAGGGAVTFTVKPYLKFSHIMGRYVMSAYCKQEPIGTDRNIIRQDIFEPLSKKWDRADWPALKQSLYDKNLLEDRAVFDAAFAYCFDGSGKQFAFVTFGYEVVASFPINVLAQLDGGDNFKANGDSAAKWIVDTIGAVLEKIKA